MIRYLPKAAIAVCAALFVSAHPAWADTQPQRSVTLMAESQDFNHDLGSLRTATLEFRLQGKPTSWTIAPTLGRRETATLHETALGGTVAVQHEWNGRLATASELFLAEDKSPFAHVSLLQEVAAKVAARSMITAGARWARYAGGQDVWFLSGGVRRYFGRGSAAYRLTWTKPTTRSGYLGHMLSFTLNDAKGAGKSQLWLSTGAASMGNAQLPDSFRGKDWAIQARRTQPLSGRMALILSGGLSSYDRPVSRVTATNIGLGIRMSW